MSPEQLKSSRDVDARTDIWSLGVILFELLTGAPPFDGATMPQLCVAIMQGDPEPPRRVPLRRAPALEAVIRKCLEKLPEQRFRHVGELAEALAPFATGRARLSVDRISGISRSSGPPRPELPSASGVTSPTVVNTSLNTSPTWSGTVVTRKRPVGLAVAAGAFVSLLAAIAVFAFLTSARAATALRPSRPPAPRPRRRRRTPRHSRRPRLRRSRRRSRPAAPRPRANGRPHGGAGPSGDPPRRRPAASSRRRGGRAPRRDPRPPRTPR